jgi:hypothetical protein
MIPAALWHRLRLPPGISAAPMHQRNGPKTRQDAARFACWRP